MSTVKDNTTELREILTAVNNLPPAGGTFITVDTELSSTSENPVQNKVIYEALEDKVEKEEGKGLSTNDLTDDLKKKYDEAYEKANEAETDPTVPTWAKQPNKPSYTASEVGARPNTWMPTASDVGARPVTWMPSYTDVGADKAGTAQSLVSGHNTNTDAHNDIRLEIQRLGGIINDILDSEDPNLDEMHEVVAYIKSNAELIEAITIAKVNVADIINNLATNVTDKPLSAAQGVALKALIDAITVPTKVSELTNDSGYQTESQVNALINDALGVIENGSY